MERKDKGFRQFRVPAIKMMGADMLALSKSAHHIASLAEIDVTGYRKAIREYRRRSGKGLSLLAFTMDGLARAIRENPCVQTFHMRGNRAVEFSEVDIAFMMEKRFRGSRIPSTYIVRDAAGKTLEAIHEDIERFMSLELDSDSPFANREGTPLFRIYPRLPRIVRMAALRWVGRHPFQVRRIGGTVLVTSLANFGRLPAWVVPLASYPLVVGIGTLSKKPWVVHDRIEVREIQNITFQFNHDFVDGADAARFIGSLVAALDRSAAALAERAAT